MSAARPAQRPWLFLALLALWCAGWLTGTIDAVRYLAGNLVPQVIAPGGWPLGLATLESLTQDLSVLALLVLAIKCAGVDLRDVAVRPRGARDWVAELGAAAAVTFVTVVGVLGLAWLPNHGDNLTGGSSSPTAAWHVMTSWTAGPLEETFFGPVCVVLGRRAGLRWRSIFIMATALRLAFHIYYGPGVITMIVWTVGTLAVYLTTGRLVGIVIAHAAHNTIVATAAYAPAAPPTVYATTAVVTLLGFLVLLAHMQVREHPNEPARAASWLMGLGSTSQNR